MPYHYPFLLDPKEYPDYRRRRFKVPTWDTFEHTTQFTTLRQLHQSTWKEDIIAYTEEFNLGKVLWPMMHVLYSPHIADVLQEIRNRKLYLFDLWSVVPGSPMEGVWSNITPPEGMVEHLRTVLGDRFLGIDNGEQDGRYVWATGEQQCPSSASRYRQYLMFQRHFQKLSDEMGNQMTALVSLCFGHYFLKEGNHMLLGAETAQALPCSQIYYAFIRGACKQYGVHWFGNASCFNRWGWKQYGPVHTEGNKSSGPEKGTSLGLLKRLLYTHYLYNSISVGFELGWLLPLEDAGAKGKEAPKYELTPIGKIQKSAVEFVAEHGQPGVMHTPVAVLVDFFAGWAPPRHLYTQNVYQVWGGLPYDLGDYLTHSVLSLLYPGYEDASYFHDERGFLTPTPFGDIADCILTDVPLTVLKQYAVVIISGKLNMTVELKEKLLNYVLQGGRLFITGTNAQGLVPDLRILDKPIRFQAGSGVVWDDGENQEIEEEWEFDLLNVSIPVDANVLMRCNDIAALVEIPRGEGTITISLTEYGLNAESLLPEGPIDNLPDAPLVQPYKLLRHVKLMLQKLLMEQRLFHVGEDLGFITCRKTYGSFTVGIYNNGLSSRPFSIESYCGQISSIKELSLDQSEKTSVGHWPEGLSENDGGSSDDSNICGGDIRLFAVKVDEQDIQCSTKVQFGSHPHNLVVALSGGSRMDGPRIQEAILSSPTFFQHYSGVLIPASYLNSSNREQLEGENGWLSRQSVQIIVDFSSVLNHYPGLTLLNAFPPHFDASSRAFDDVFSKMLLIGANDALITLHRKPESHWDSERAENEFIKRVGDLCGRAGKHGITIHLQAHPMRWVKTTDQAAAFIRKIGISNLKLAINTGHLNQVGETLAGAISTAGDILGSVLVCAANRDRFGQWYDAHLPAHSRDVDLHGLGDISGRRDVLFVLYGDYPSIDDAYADLVLLRKAQSITVKN